MRHFGKRSFALILALMLCLSLFPSALAEDAGSIAAEDAPEQEITIAPAEEGDIAPAEEGSIAPADEGSIRPAEEGDALPRADETQDGATSGQCGDDLNWSFDEATGTLSITGSGDMWDWSFVNNAPWYSERESIKSVELPQGLTSIGGNAFQDCRLTAVDIPDGVTRISSNAFFRCGWLTCVTIPEGVNSIGFDAFRYCSALPSITIPASATEIDPYALQHCTSLKDIYFGGSCEAWRRFNLVYDRSSVTVHCADGTIETYIVGDRQCGENLFWSLANGVLTISGTGDMWNYEIYYDDSAKTDLSTAPWFPQREMITRISLSEGVTSIGNYAFSTFRFPLASAFCENLVSIDLPETLQRIGTCGLAGSSALKEIRLPDSLTEIGDYAFESCGLIELTMPLGLETIGYEAFRLSSLSEIRFLGDSPAIDSTAFYGKTVTAYYPLNNSTWTESVKRSYGGVITWEPYVATDSTLSLGDATACAGRGFTVELTLDENPGVMGISFQLDYDSSVMEFVGAEDGVLTGWTVNAKKNILVWDDDREHTDTGCLLKLKFRLKEDAGPGETRIGLTDLDVGNYNEDNLYFQVRSGRVTVLVHRPGDANGDGKVNVNDLIRLRKFLVGAEKEIIAGNADVNADEVVDLLDLVRLRKYIAQVDGVILE